MSRTTPCPPEDLAGLIAAWARNIVASTDGAIYVCVSTKEWASVSRAFEDAGGHWSDTIVWKKDRFVMGRADYQRQYEPIWFGWPEGAKHHWCGVRDQGDVWEIARPSDSDAHPTMKPLALVERAIENSSTRGDVALDLFPGSGSTLIASERTGRVCLWHGGRPGLWQRCVGALGSFYGRDGAVPGFVIVRDAVRSCTPGRTTTAPTRAASKCGCSRWCG